MAALTMKGSILAKFEILFSFHFAGETQSQADYVQLLDEAVNRVQSSSSQRKQTKITQY